MSPSPNSRDEVPDITGYLAAATFVSFGLPSYREVTRVLPSLFQGYGSVTFSAGPGGTDAFAKRLNGAWRCD